MWGLHLGLTGGSAKEQGVQEAALQFLVFRLSDWEGDVKLGFFFLSFSFIVITKYIPMMENYGFLLAIWQLCLYLFFRFWCVF